MSDTPGSSPHPGLRVVLIEDHDMVAEAIELAFNSLVDIHVVARARSGAEGLAQVSQYEPDVVVLDRRLPDADGIELISDLRARAGTTRVLVLTGEASPAVAARVVTAGGDGLVIKTSRLNELADAVRRVAAGEAVFGTDLLASALDRLSGNSAGANLTPREQQTLVLLAGGATTEQIAERLRLTRNTVRNHVQRLLGKLGAHSKLEAVAIARREGLID